MTMTFFWTFPLKQMNSEQDTCQQRLYLAWGGDDLRKANTRALVGLKATGAEVPETSRERDNGKVPVQRCFWKNSGPISVSASPQRSLTQGSSETLYLHGPLT
jgi:hypothetical protein